MVSSQRSPVSLKKRIHESLNKRDHRQLGMASVQVYEALRQQILDGDLPPGTRLGQRAIAEVMGSSNGPVISALRRLAHEGLITYEHGQGGMVKQFSEEQLADWMVLRRALETEAARLAARRASPDEIDRLYAIVDQMSDIVRREAWDEGDQADVELHVSIARLSCSSSLIEALNRCHVLELVRRRLLASEGRRDLTELDVNHRKLVDAIASHDSDRAGQAMHAHLNHFA